MTRLRRPAGAAADSAGGHLHVRPVTLAALLAGRAAWRGALTVSNVVLLAVWGQAAFADYATAMGTATVLTLLAASVEKGALNLVPRARSTRPILIGGLVGAAFVLPLPVLAWLAGSWLLGRPGVGPLQLTAALFQSMLGLVMALVAMQRAVGRPYRDSQAYLALTLAILLACLLTVLLRLPPGAVVALLLAAAVVVCGWLLRSLPVRLRGLWRRRLLLRSVGGTLAMMGAYDLGAGTMASVVYAVLAATRFRVEAAQLYIALSVWALVSSAFNYLLRVFQPGLAVSVEATGEAAARRRARHLARLAMAVCGAETVLVLLGAALVARGVLPRPPPALTLPLVLAGLLIARLPLFLLTGVATYLLENARARSLKLAATSAAGALLAGAALGLLLIPRLGAAGAAFALIGYDIAQALVLLRGLTAPPRAAPG